MLKILLISSYRGRRGEFFFFQQFGNYSNDFLSIILFVFIEAKGAIKEVFPVFKGALMGLSDSVENWNCSVLHVVFTAD